MPPKDPRDNRPAAPSTPPEAPASPLPDPGKPLEPPEAHRGGVAPIVQISLPSPTGGELPTMEAALREIKPIVVDVSRLHANAVATQGKTAKYFLTSTLDCPQENPTVGGQNFPRWQEDVKLSESGAMTERNRHRGVLLDLTEEKVNVIIAAAGLEYYRFHGKAVPGKYTVADSRYRYNPKTDVPLACFLVFVPLSEIRNIPADGDWRAMLDSKTMAQRNKQQARLAEENHHKNEKVKELMKLHRQGLIASHPLIEDDVVDSETGASYYKD